MVSKNTIEEPHQSSQHALSAGLYMVATPIGHYDDITLRALKILKTADYIACEDTRVTHKMLAHHNIKASLLCYNDHSSEGDRKKILSHIHAGKSVALVSDAGTPMISDPGYKLVLFLREHEVPIHSLPGASSVIMALTLSGMPTDSFHFAGFLPSKEQAKQKKLMELAQYATTIVLFESARRIGKTVELIRDVFGNDTSMSVLRELTKTYEEVKIGTASELANYYKKNTPKGEIIIVINAATQKTYTEDELVELIRESLQNASVKDTVEYVSGLVSVPKKKIYQYALSLKEKGDISD
ncbi:MAG: 16S rRNA (cytidine(1402)-2'-O)-methyltransferase [Rickettsiales bacterium]|nr:16S rRNA (cytidine(1402)-2'-O)-methyltransferase [Rickettsiales bacterium]